MKDGLNMCLRVVKPGFCLWCFVLVGVCVAEPAIEPYESGDKYVARNKIDALVRATLDEKGIEPAKLCSDEVFIRRVYLDMTGRLPEPWVVRRFLENPRGSKRGAIINKLMETEEFADYWALKWCDILRVKAEFPINLWPNGVQAYYRWIRQAVKENMPYDEFARALLTSSGSNFRVPPVNFYRAIQGEEAEAIARAVGLTFMGCRVEEWNAEKREGLEAFFSRLLYKNTAEWKEQIICLDPGPAGELTARFPDGEEVTIKAGEDPRGVFADWLIQKDNAWFAKNIVNRQWSWLMGRGIIHEPDDIRDGNPAVNPELLEYLESELAGSGYDLRHVFKLILNSHTYQQSSVPADESEEVERYFAVYPVRRLDAEVLIDALCWISGTNERYSSKIPEPFTFVPADEKTVELADGSITSQFLEMFGRPSRDTGLESERNREVTERQRLHLLNSSQVQNKIEKGWRIRNLMRRAKGNKQVMINQLYLHILSRFPTAEERETVTEYFEMKGMNNRRAVHDIAWALINTKEFLYRH
ncbi:DUF1553 domain-containing protein [Anaerohalosphaera lusitana]|nr:DUF1553 domain-containing protein [Anaerohalosphaera lusitana]